MKKEITIDDVLEFIDEQGDIYDARIQEKLDKKKNITDEDIEDILNNRNNMYERLAKL